MPWRHYCWLILVCAVAALPASGATNYFNPSGWPDSIVNNDPSDASPTQEEIFSLIYGAAERALALLYPGQTNYAVWVEEEPGEWEEGWDIQYWFDWVYPCKYFSEEIPHGWSYNTITPPSAIWEKVRWGGETSNTFTTTTVSRTVWGGTNWITTNIDLVATNVWPVYESYYAVCTAWPDELRKWAFYTNTVTTEGYPGGELDIEWSPNEIWNTDETGYFQEPTEGIHDTNAVIVWNEWPDDAMNVYSDFAVDDMIRALLPQYAAWKGTNSLEYHFTNASPRWTWGAGLWTCDIMTFPDYIPNWTVSNFWHYAGLPIVEYRTLETNDVQVYGWEVGNYTSQYVTLEDQVQLLKNEIYCFTEYEAGAYPPVLLGEVHTAPPVIIDWFTNVFTNGSAVVTSTTPKTITMDAPFLPVESIGTDACRPEQWPNLQAVVIPYTTNASFSFSADCTVYGSAGVQDDQQAFISTNGEHTFTLAAAGVPVTNDAGQYFSSVAGVLFSGQTVITQTFELVTASNLVEALGDSLHDYGFALSLRVPSTFERLSESGNTHMSWTGLMQRVYAINAMTATELHFTETNITTDIYKWTDECIYGNPYSYFSSTTIGSGNDSCLGEYVINTSRVTGIYPDVESMIAEQCSPNDGFLVHTNDSPYWQNPSFGSGYYNHRITDYSWDSTSGGCTDTGSATEDRINVVLGGVNCWTWTVAHTIDYQTFMPYPGTSASLDSYFRYEFYTENELDQTDFTLVDWYLYPSCNWDPGDTFSFTGAYTRTWYYWPPGCLGVALDPDDCVEYVSTNDVFRSWDPPDLVKSNVFGMFTREYSSGTVESGDFWDMKTVHYEKAFPSPDCGGVLSYESFNESYDDGSSHISETTTTFIPEGWSMSVNAIRNVVKWDFLYGPTE